MALLAERIVDVVDRQVLLAQADDQRAGGILLGLHLRPARRVGEEVALLAVAEGVAQYPKGARSVSEASSGLRRRQAVREVGPQRLVLPVPRLLRLAKEPGRVR